MFFVFKFVVLLLFVQRGTAYLPTSPSWPEVLDAILKWCFKNSFYNGILLVYRNTSDICALICAPATFLNFLITTKDFLWILWDFLYIESCHLQIVGFFFFFLSNVVVFYFFLLPIRLWLELLLQY